MTDAQLPFAPACERNKAPIAAALARLFVQPGEVLELGSGTGQHAVHFAAALPHLRWQPTDLPAQLPGIRGWRETHGPPNLQPPHALDLAARPWPFGPVPYVFSANTTQVAPWNTVASMLAGIGEVLAPGGLFCLYGPFAEGGRHTAASNADFDAWLRSRDPAHGVRDIHDLQTAAAPHLTLDERIPMPANNQLLVWRRAVSSQED